MAKGFGKADRMVEKERVLSRIRAMPPEIKAEVDAMCSVETLTEKDWSYLAKDFAVMVSVLVGHECPEFEGQGGHFYVEDDGSVTGLAFVKHKATGENVGVVLKQEKAGQPEYHPVEVFTSVASGETAIPEASLDEVGKVAERTLNREALAYSFIFRGEKKGFRAGYGWSEGHVEDKVKGGTPEGCEAVVPVPISKHESTTKAITFAHIMNRNAGVLFGGVPYEEMDRLLEMGR